MIYAQREWEIIYREATVQRQRERRLQHIRNRQRRPRKEHKPVQISRKENKYLNKLKNTRLKTQMKANRHRYNNPNQRKSFRSFR